MRGGFKCGEAAGPMCICVCLSFTLTLRRVPCQTRLLRMSKTAVEDVCVNVCGCRGYVRQCMLLLRMPNMAAKDAKHGC